MTKEQITSFFNRIKPNCFSIVPENFSVFPQGICGKILVVFVRPFQNSKYNLTEQEKHNSLHDRFHLRGKEVSWHSEMLISRQSYHCVHTYKLYSLTQVHVWICLTSSKHHQWATICLVSTRQPLKHKLYVIQNKQTYRK